MRCGDRAHSLPAGISSPLGIPGLIKYLVQTRGAGRRQHAWIKSPPRAEPGGARSPPLLTEEAGGGQEREEGERADDKHGTDTDRRAPGALAAPEGIKWDRKRTSQVGSVPAKRCSVLFKKMKLTSLSLATGVESPWERGAGLSALNLASRTLAAS